MKLLHINNVIKKKKLNGLNYNFPKTDTHTYMGGPGGGDEETALPLEIPALLINIIHFGNGCFILIIIII